MWRQGQDSFESHKTRASCGIYFNVNGIRNAGAIKCRNQQNADVKNKKNKKH